MPSENIDSASLHSLVSGLLRRGDSDWTLWERRSIAEVTLGLLFRINITIPAPPKSGNISLGKDLVESIQTALPEFVSEPKISSSLKKKALLMTQSWIKNNSKSLLRSFTLMKNDPSCDHFARWAIERDWPYHVARLGSLVDEPIFPHLAKTLGLSIKEEKTLLIESSNINLIRLMSERYAATGHLPPQEMIDAYLLSVLTRGRYYQYLASLKGGYYVWHSARNYVLNPVEHISDINNFSNRLVELFLAGMICRGAMEEGSDEKVINSWAENIRKLKAHSLFLPKESDYNKAVSIAVEHAKKYDLQFRWPRLDTILEGTLHNFILPLIGIAAGLFTFDISDSHYLAMAAHEGVHFVARPFAESLVSTIEESTRKSTPYLKYLAKNGTQRVFAITKDDLIHSIEEG
jgi:hypothetical protein